MTAPTRRTPIALTLPAEGGLGLVVRPGRLGRLAAIGSLAALFLMSSYMLAMLGIGYGTYGGNPLEKFHPATYLALIGVVLALLGEGPGSVLGRSWRDHPGVIVYACGLLLLGFQAVGIQQAPASAIADVFLLPLALFLCIIRLDGPDRARLAVALHALFALNTALGYIEGLSGWRLTPLVFDGKAVAWEWRSSAFFGHPLTNSALTAIYITFLATGAGRFSSARRIGLILFNLGAMPFFGGRTALLIAVVVLSAAVALVAARTLVGRRFRIESLIAGILVGTLLGLAVFALIEAGTFDRFINRFVDDHGSASTRLTMLSIFKDLTPAEFLLAPDPGTIANTQRRLGLHIGIESFVIAFIAYYGVLVTALFFVALAFFIREVVRFAGPRAILPLAVFFALNAAATGIANKSVDLAMVVAMAMLLAPAGADRRPEQDRC